jgi:hypothetical protein
MGTSVLHNIVAASAKVTDESATATGWAGFCADAGIRASVLQPDTSSTHKPHKKSKLIFTAVVFEGVFIADSESEISIINAEAMILFPLWLFC